MKKLSKQNLNQRQEVIETVNRIILNFCKEWQKSPLLWEKEIDIQIELVVRLKMGLRPICGKTFHYVIDPPRSVYNIKEKYQNWSFVDAEPLIRINKQEKYYPDIIIYGIGHKAVANEENYPFIAAIEIKTGYFNELSNKKESQKKELIKLREYKDFLKLEKLTSLRKGPEKCKGYFLNFSYEPLWEDKKPETYLVNNINVIDVHISKSISRKKPNQLSDL